MAGQIYSDPRHKRLQDMPLERLNLTVKTYNLVKSTGMSTISDCLDHFLIRGAMVTFKTGLVEAMNNEVKQKLKDAGYWALLEEYDESLKS